MLVYYAIISQLEKELVNGGLQVYVGDIEDANALITQLSNLILQVYLQVWEKAQTDHNVLISDVAKLFVLLRKKAHTSNELIDKLNMGSLYKLRRYILEPAISAGYIAMSRPDKPTSSKQRYMLSQMGLDLFK